MKYALVVGINQYPDPDDKLVCAVNDSIEMERVLERSEYGFKVVRLNDESATRATIRDYMMMISEEKDLSDFIFYFSGHGVSTSSDSFLCTSDMRQFEEGISIGQLSRMLSPFVDRNITTTVILDACHTGEFKVYQSRGYANLIPDSVNTVLSTLPSDICFLAACGRAEVCTQNFEKGLSEFTISLLDGLNGGCADENGFVTVSMLFRYINSTYNSKGGPKAVFRATISDDYYLGTGFPPRLLAINSDVDQITELVTQGQSLLDEYLKIGESSVEAWNQIQFTQSAKKLSSIIQWIRSQETKHPELKVLPEFLRVRSAVTSRLKRLGNIDEGAILGDFVFEKPFGSGSFGTVWKTINRITQEVRAFKVYHSNDLDLVDKSNRFLRGYKAMQRIDHPQVVKVMSWYDAPYAFDMEFIDGLNLRQLGGAIGDEESLITFLMATADILSFTHKEGVFHRDIKPENVMAVWDNAKGYYIPVITDFDLAWFDTATKMTRDALGSLGYAAPEQLSSTDARVTRQPTVDIYSFGQLMYFLIQGKDPRQNAGIYNSENLKARLHTWASPIVAESVGILYEGCTKDNPKERYQSFDELVGFLQNILSEQYSLRSGNISPSNYIDFVLHGFNGISKSSTHNSFLTVTGRSIVQLQIDGNSIKITLSANGLPLFESMNNTNARKVLFDRFKRKFQPFRNVEIEHGTEGAFQVHVILHLKSLDLTSLVQVRDHITRAISEMEH